MPLSAGTRIGPFEIRSLLGAGGMGEVYRAFDGRLGREAAIKFVRAESSSDPDRLRRFEQEARAVAALNHPNILTVHEVGTHEGVPYLVTELLDGQTLRQRLRSSGLTVREAVECAVQIARGLAAAHEKGIVHRDLKPENVFLTRDGGVKVLDFGLAKLRAERRSSSQGKEEVTASTETGVVLGTAAYMSPEQVRAQPVDNRSDIFSLGTVLYEMLSRRRPFAGESTAELMAAILKEDPPDLDAMVKAPPSLERIVRRCLEKSPGNRFHSAHDLALALEAVSGSSASGATVVDAPARASRRRGVIVAGSLLLPLALGLAFLTGRWTGAVPAPSYHQLTFRRGTVLSARFAPDGRSVVYSAIWDGAFSSEMFSTRLDSPVSRPLGLPGAAIVATGGGEMAVVVESEMLGRAPLDGGPVRAVAEVVRDADWSPGGTFAIVRAMEGRQRLEFPAGKVLHETDGQGEIVGPRLARGADRIAFVYRTSFSGTPASVAVVDLGGRLTTLSSVWSDIEGLAWSPDGTEVWFTGAKAGTAKALYAVSLSGRERLVQRVPGRLTLYDVFPDGRVLLGVERYREEMQGRLADDPAERILSWLDGSGSPVVSDDGTTLVFGDWGEGGGPRGSVYLRRGGEPPVRLGDAMGGPMAISPDGAWVLAQVEQQPGLPLQLLPTGAGEPIVLPPGPLVNVAWSWFFPDGKRIAILGNEAGRPTRLFVQDLPGGTPRPFTPEDTMAHGAVFTADGRYMAASPRVWPPAFKLYPVDGGKPLPIPGLAKGDYPNEWSGDRRFMFVRHRGDGRLGAPIFRVEVQTGARTLWKSLAPSDPAGVRDINIVSISADGQSYAFSFTRTLSDLYLVEGLR